MTNQHTFAAGLFYYTLQRPHQRQSSSFCSNFLIEYLFCVLLCSVYGVVLHMAQAFQSLACQVMPVMSWQLTYSQGFFQAPEPCQTL